MSEKFINIASKNIRDILDLSIKFPRDGSNKALVIYDTNNGLTNILLTAYRQVLPEAKFVDFDTVDKPRIMAEFDQLQPNDLVVMIQTSNFRLDDFRIRIHLFAKKLKVIEHMHLYRNDPAVWDVYVNALEYDVNWFLPIANKIKQQLELAKEFKLISLDSELIVTGGLESPKLNVGDYTGMENIGGTFPIGEIFTEAKNFAAMNGAFYVYAFANQDFSISMHEPFRVDVKEGLVVGVGDNAPQGFRDILELIKRFERPLIREIGFGLNRAITKERYLGDITAFERIYGMHLSLGEKHSVYKKTGIKTNKSKFHVDLFPVLDSASADGQLIFVNGHYVL
ncbi:MAG: hypothetical protein HY817_02340 [Candidatus Abawacabacteria bacterium]|nr:hypothetical protein [Candidatus Abawacabacteria bacterium]